MTMSNAVNHNLIMDYIEVDKYHLGSSRDINRLVGKEVLRCESAMDMTDSQYGSPSHAL